MLPPPCVRAALLRCLILVAAPFAHAGIILNFDNPSIAGQPGDMFTLTGAISHVDPSEDLTFVQSTSLTSSVLQLIGIDAPGFVPYPAGFTGNIVTVQIVMGAIPGMYPSNPFSLTYDSINGRTFTTNSADISVEVQAAVIPEPSTLLLALASLACIGTLRRRRPHHAKTWNAGRLFS